MLQYPLSRALNAYKLLKGRNGFTDYAEYELTSLMFLKRTDSKSP